MDDELLIETLLYKGEGTTLDYKVQQYPHDGATPEVKGELLKDILAFANAWRQENAYILIGVSDSGELVGLDKDLDDARLQQFISGKTNTPIHFSYRSLTFKGIQLGLYTIETQERPIYAKQAYGKVLADTVYVRRGSSTAIAKPEEIAKMGADQIAKTQMHAPILSLQLMGSDDIVVDSIHFDYKNLIIEDQDKLPDLVEQRTAFGLYDIGARYDMSHINPSYYRELASYIQQHEGTFGFRLLLTNTGTNFAADVKIYLNIPIIENLQLVEEHDILCKPKQRTSILDAYKNNIPPINFLNRSISITSERDLTTAVFHIGKIQSGETLSTDYIYLVRPPQSLESINVRILSDQLRNPIELNIPTTIKEEKTHITLNDIKCI
ncbi:AlbA family DNA-binding domain-containing protein [Pseudomonas frederiksbergensis]|uniref:AlbA family DNA-binding domain-containing protein n=1 Tax=Pseudomonas frederiksbergensis TaxID=104087 RepID=UPI003D1D688E